MKASDTSDFRFLIVPGLHGSGAGHWQTRWRQLHPSFQWVEQENWDIPDVDVWSEQLHRALRASSQPTLIVAHSFGCLTTVHSAGLAVNNLAGVLLVAPADPFKFGLAARLDKARLACPAIMIGSTSDPWMTSSRAENWAQKWQAEFVNAGDLGHINAESGLGDWSYGLSQLKRLVAIATLVRKHESDFLAIP